MKTTEEEEASSPLGRKPRESEVAHRALLLYCMQTPKKRNMRAVSRAVERSNTTVRQYSQTWEWQSRMVGPTRDAEAQQLYRQLYFDKVGMKEIAMIEENIVSPISVMGNTSRPVADTIQRTIAETQPQKSNVFTKEIKRKHLALVDAGIGYIAQGLKEGDIKRSLRDLPLLMTLRRELTEENKDKNANTIQIIESARVRIAKANGDDIVEAMFEDAQELVAILGALAYKGKAPSYDSLIEEE